MVDSKLAAAIVESNLYGSMQIKDLQGLELDYFQVLNFLRRSKIVVRHKGKVDDYIDKIISQFVELSDLVHDEIKKKS